MTTPFEDLMEDQEFHNALATLLNKAYAKGHAAGYGRAMSQLNTALNMPVPTAGVLLPIDNRDLKTVTLMREHLTESPTLPLDALLGDLQPLTLGTYNDLSSAGIVTIADLLSKGPREISLMSGHRSGYSMVTEIMEALEGFGYTKGMSDYGLLSIETPELTGTGGGD